MNFFSEGEFRLGLLKLHLHRNLLVGLVKAQISGPYAKIVVEQSGA